jgi:hypothetical protein
MDFKAAIWEINQKKDQLNEQWSHAWLEIGDLDKADAIYKEIKKLEYQIETLEYDMKQLFN